MSMATRSWVDISRAALHANVRTLRAIVGRDRILCAVVKANAYGHGIRELAEKIGTINYEVVTRINPVLARKVV